MLGYKASFNQFYMIKIILNIFTDHSEIKPKFNNEMITREIHKYFLY